MPLHLHTAAEGLLSPLVDGGGVEHGTDNSAGLTGTAYQNWGKPWTVLPAWRGSQALPGSVFSYGSRNTDSDSIVN